MKNIRQASYMTQEELNSLPVYANLINEKYYHWKYLLQDKLSDESLTDKEGMRIIAKSIIDKGKMVQHSLFSEQKMIEVRFKNVDGDLLVDKFIEYFKRMIVGSKPKNQLFLFIVFLYWKIYFEHVKPNYFLSRISSLLKQNRVESEKRINTIATVSPLFLKEVDAMKNELISLRIDEDFLKKFNDEIMAAEPYDISTIFEKYKGALIHKRELGVTD